MVKETKSSMDKDKRRPTENDKIACGIRHFEALDNVSFAVAVDGRTDV